MWLTLHFYWITLRYTTQTLTSALQSKASCYSGVTCVHTCNVPALGGGRRERTKGKQDRCFLCALSVKWNIMFHSPLEWSGFLYSTLVRWVSHLPKSRVQCFTTYTNINKPQKPNAEQRKQIVGVCRWFTLQRIVKLQSYMLNMDIHRSNQRQLGTVIHSGEEGRERENVVGRGFHCIYHTLSLVRWQRTAIWYYFYPLCRLDIFHNEGAFICILLTHWLGIGRGSVYLWRMQVLCA